MWYPPKKFPPKKFPAIKFPKLTTWDKKFPFKKVLKYTTCAKPSLFSIGFGLYNTVNNIIRTIIMLIIFIKIVLNRNFCPMLSILETFWAETFWAGFMNPFFWKSLLNVC